jgi:16S rRNA processing protein RimM
MSENQNNKNLKNEKQSGSLTNSEPEFLVVGKIGKTHGLRGELWMNLLTDFPERLVHGKHIFIGAKYREHVIKAFRVSNKRGLISFADYRSPEEARILTNQYVYVDARDMPDLPDEEFYHHDLIGIRVVDEEQRLIGFLKEIIVTGANDVYVVAGGEGDEKEVLIPAIESVVIRVDIREKIMVVRLQEWA